MDDINRDGIPLNAAALPRLLPLPVQIAILLAHALAASILRDISDDRARVSADRAARNPRLQDATLEPNPLTARVRKWLDLADAVGEQALLQQLENGNYIACGETTGNLLDGKRAIPREAWRFHGTGHPKLHLLTGSARHAAWDPNVVHAIVILKADTAHASGASSRPARRSGRKSLRPQVDEVLNLSPEGNLKREPGALLTHIRNKLAVKDDDEGASDQTLLRHIRDWKAGIKISK